VLPPEIPTDLAFALFRPSVQPYLISWFKYDPAVELSRVAHASIRALALAGTSDLQVFTVDGERLATASGNRLASIDNMTHVLREATRDPADNARTYSNPSLPLARGLVSTLAGFIRSGSY
jgi:hypothetical protein